MFADEALMNQWFRVHPPLRVQARLRILRSGGTIPSGPEDKEELVSLLREARAGFAWKN